jgi:hypothetical protein
MGKETFLLLFVLGAAALAAWTSFRLPELAPRSFRVAALHLGAALAVGSLLGPAARYVAGVPTVLSLYLALFTVALPALTYMLLVGIWIVRMGVDQTLAPRG